MRLTVLVDNNTYIDQYYKGEPAVSYHMEDNGMSILLDVGYSNVFIENAEFLGIDIWNLDMIVLSHGHNDHTRGLKYFIDDERLTRKRTKKEKIKLVAHPHAFNPKVYGDEDIGMPCTMEQLESVFDVIRAKDSIRISDGLYYLGEIPRVTDFENQKPVGKCSCDCQTPDERSLDDRLIDDYLLDDTAIAYKANDGIFIITGCSHSGICNIIEHSKTVCDTEWVRGIIGGFHLFELDEQAVRTIDTIAAEDMRELYPCHCTSFVVRSALHQRIPVNEVGVGLQLVIL